MLQNTKPPIKKKNTSNQSKTATKLQHKNDTFMYNKSFDACLLKNHFYWGVQRMADYFILLGQ